MTAPSAARGCGRSDLCLGRLDVVVNNPSYANTNSIEAMAEGDVRAQIETKVFGAVT